MKTHLVEKTDARADWPTRIPPARADDEFDGLHALSVLPRRPFRGPLYEVHAWTEPLEMWQTWDTWRSVIGQSFTRPVITHDMQAATRVSLLVSNVASARRRAFAAENREHTVVEGKSLARVFDELVNTWKQETMLESSVQRKVIHRAYQQIIGLGPDALPLVLRELAREPDYWFWALTAITREDPADSEETLEGATDRWLEWGRERGLIG